MIAITTKSRMEDFETRGQYRDSTGGSDDGYRRDYSYTVHTNTKYVFTNEKLENGVYSYDLEVLYHNDSGHEDDYTENIDKFKEHYSEIAYSLYSHNGALLLNYPACIPAEYECASFISFSDQHGSFRTDENEDALIVKFKSGSGAFTLIDGEKDTISYQELMDKLTGNEDKASMLNRASNNHIQNNKEYYIRADTIPEEKMAPGDFSSEWRFKVKKVSLSDMLSNQIVTDDDIRDFLQVHAHRLNEANRYYVFNMDVFKEYVGLLPAEDCHTLLAHSNFNETLLDLYRIHCPEKIEWNKVPVNSMKDSDLDLMIASDNAGGCSSEYYERCMEIPQLEKKIVDNISVFAQYRGCNADWFAEHLHTCTKADVLHNSIYKKHDKLFMADGSMIYGPDFEAYASLNREDYENLKACAMDSKSEELISLTLQAGIVSGADDKDIVGFMNDYCKEHWERKYYFENRKSQPYKVLEHYEHTSGIKFIESRIEKIEADKRRNEERLHKLSQNVVDYVRNSSKAAIPINNDGYTSKTQRSICKDSEWNKDCHDKRIIGDLSADESSVTIISGYKADYLVDIEKCKKLANGVLHMDVAEDDAGRIIGKGGAKIKELTQKLNEKGANIKSIKLHTHPIEELENMVRHEESIMMKNIQHDLANKTGPQNAQSNASQAADAREMYKQQIHASAMGFGLEANATPSNSQSLTQS